MPVLYGTNIADGSLVTACDMATASGGSETTVNTTFTNNLNHYAEAYAQGGTSIGSFASIPTTPTGHGWVYAPGIGAFDAGNWSAQVAFNDSLGPSPIDDITLRFFKNSGSSYTLLGSTVVTSPTLQTTRTDITFSPVALSATTFAAGEMVYVDIWYHNTVASGGAGNITDISPSVYVGTSATAGVASDMQITTTTWTGDTVDPYIILLYGSNVADATLTTARQMGTNVGGTEVLSTAMTWTTTNAFGEIISAGGSIASAAAISAPTGRGWIYDPGPGPGTFALGNWSASIAMSDTTGPSTPTDITLRIYKYVSGTYTAIGSIVLLAPTVNTTRTVLTFAATSMPNQTFAVGEMIYCDLWYHTTDVTTDHPAVYVSTSATVGVASDMQVTTAIFTPTIATLAPNGRRPMWVMRALTGPIFNPIRAVPAWVERALTGPFIRPTQPVRIPHYVRRSLTNVLFNYTPATTLRTKVRTLTSKVANLRTLVGTQVTRSAGLRTIVTASVNAAKSAVLRTLVRSQKSVSTGVRTPVRTQVTKSTALRVRLASQKTVSSGVRTVVRGITRLASIRTRVRTQATRSSQVRTPVRSLSTRSSVLRTLVRTAHSLSTSLRANVRTQVTRSSVLRAVIRGITRIASLRIPVRTQRALSVVLRTLARSLKTGTSTLRTNVRTTVSKSSVLRTLVGTGRSLSTVLRTRVRSLRTLSTVLRVVTTFVGVLVTKSTVVRLVARTLHSLSIGVRTRIRSQVTRSAPLRAIVRGMTRVASLRIVARGRSLLVGTRIPVRTVRQQVSQVRAVVRSQAGRVLSLRTRVGTLIARSTVLRLVLRGLTRVARMRVPVRSQRSVVTALRTRAVAVHVLPLFLLIPVRSVHTPVASVRVLVYVLPPVPNATLLMREGEAEMLMRSGQATFYIRSGKATIEMREQ